MYLLDSSVFIEAEKRYYPKNLCPGFWDSVSRCFNDGFAMSLDQVQDEISKQDDHIELTLIELCGEDFFLDSGSAAIISEVARITVNLKDRNKYTQPTLMDMERGADLYLIAVCFLNNWTLVTEEKESPYPNQKTGQYKAKIPAICQDFNIRCLRTTEFLIEMNHRYILE